jgi:hypothetical protein
VILSTLESEDLPGLPYPWRSFMRTIFAFLACAGGLLAGTTSCPTGSTTLNSGASGVSVPFSSTPSLSPVELSTINSGTTGFTSGITAGGCNLVVQGTGVTGTNSYATVSTSDVAQAITFATMAGDSSSVSADHTNSFTVGNVGNGGSIDFVDYSNFGTTTTPSSVGVGQIDVTLSGVNIGAVTGNTIVVSEVVCSNVSGTGSVGAFTSCTSGSNQPGGTNVVTTTLTFTSADVVGGNITFAVAVPSVSSIAADFTVSLNWAGGGLTSFDTFEESFDSSTTPEPSTLFLLGPALAGIGFLRVRARRRRT